MCIYVLFIKVKGIQCFPPEGHTHSHRYYTITPTCWKTSETYLIVVKVQFKHINTHSYNIKAHNLPSCCSQYWLPRRQLRWGAHLITHQQGCYLVEGNVRALFRHLAAKTGKTFLSSFFPLSFKLRFCLVTPYVNFSWC